jgi:hypothetical protein
MDNLAKRGKLCQFVRDEFIQYTGRRMWTKVFLAHGSGKVCSPSAIYRLFVHAKKESQSKNLHILTRPNPFKYSVLCMFRNS